MKLNDIKNFSSIISGKLVFDYDLRNTNWFNIGGKTKIFFKPESLRELIDFLKIYKRRGKIFVLGAGSNVLFPDNTYEGVVIKLGKNFNRISKLNEDTIIAGSNALDKGVSEYAMTNEIGGLEFLSCIPGSIGGGIRMNAGCYGREFKNILVSVQATDLDGKVFTIPSKDINFFYRGSDLNKEFIFLSATIKGEKSTKIQINKKIENLKKKKELTQPTKIKTSGSTFKNPIDQTQIKVWQLIKQSVSLKKSFGDAAISDHHSNFFVNRKNANSKDMRELIVYVQKEVKKKFNVNIETEVVLVD